MPHRPRPTIQDNKDGTVSVGYHPKDKGTHEVNILHNEQVVDGTPFRCHVDSSGNTFVTVYGEGLTQAECGEEVAVTIVGAGKDLDFSVTGPNKAEITKRDVDGPATNICFRAMSSGEYAVNIKVKGKHIHGSPFSCKVTGEGRKRSQLSLVGTSEMGLGPQGVDLTNTIGILKTPSGSSEPILLKKMPDGQLGVSSFAPRSKGTYTVEITKDGSTLPGSPFKINVDEHKVASPGKVHSGGAGLKEGKANTWNVVELNIADAGHGSIAFSVEGPHRSDLDSHKDNGKYTIRYRPHEPGMYLLNIRFADEHVTGSPFMLSVTGEASGRVRETVSKQIQPVSHCGPGSKCEFQLKIPGTNPLDMEAVLTSPTGKSELCAIADLPDSLYDIKFEPAEEGVHTVSLKHKGLHIAGSPFQYTVGQPPNAGPHKVEIGGPGLEGGEVGARNEFNVYTREAGGGNLSIAIEGPSKAKMEVVDRGHGYTTVSYIVTKPGQYGIHVKYDDSHVPDSPAMVQVAPEAGDAKLVTIQGLRDRGLDVDKPVTFNVDLCSAKGELKAHVSTPSGEDQEVFMNDIDKGVYAIRFVPKENGVYYVHIKFNESHIPGSPIPMLVGKLGADAALVMAHGDGLTKGETGKPCKMVVQTVNSGTGMLSVRIDGPTKVAIVCTEVDDGYEFAYTPMAPGDYMISIKYCNVTIAGMPSLAKITGKGKSSSVTEHSHLAIETVEKKPGASAKKRFHGDASKVKAQGNGLKKGFAGRPGTFTIDVKGAGNALLTGGMITPTGNPTEEFGIKRQRGTSYQITYRTAEKGEHTLHLRWGSDDIPGSPFTIPVA